MSINQNSQNDLFIFNFPMDFVPKELEDKYNIHLKNFHKPFATVLDYTNSNIKDINLPAMTFPTVTQKKYYGKERDFRGSKSPYDLYNRDLTVTVQSVDFHISYIMMQDILLYHYIKNGKPFLEDFKVTVLDEERREQYRIVFREVVPTGLSDLRLAYPEKSADEQVYTVSFKYNFIDIEYIPRYADGSASGELIEEYSDQIMKNDEFIINNPNPDTLSNGTAGEGGIIPTL